MNDMRAVIVPKSDQINADDLIAGPRTITVREVQIRGGQEQPVSIFFDGDDGKPWRPCKSMSRVLVHCWGADAKNYVGRSLTLYRDPSVKWGGMEVGGIRISHMSDIASKVQIALTATKGQRKPHTVLPLVIERRQATQQAPKKTFAQVEAEIDALPDAAAVSAWLMDNSGLKDNDSDRVRSLYARAEARGRTLSEAPDTTAGTETAVVEDDDFFPGDVDVNNHA